MPNKAGNAHERDHARILALRDALAKLGMTAADTAIAIRSFPVPTKREIQLLDWRLSKQGKRWARRRGV